MNSSLLVTCSILHSNSAYSRPSACEVWCWENRNRENNLTCKKTQNKGQQNI